MDAGKAAVGVTRDGVEVIYPSPEQAAEALNLTARQVAVRADGRKTVKNMSYRWTDETYARSRTGRRSRHKGARWELEIIRRLKEIGYTGCVSSRAESKTADGMKIDIVDTENRLPCYIQAKCVSVMPNYHRVRKACPLKDKPFVMAVKQEGEEPLAVLPIEYFYKLLKRSAAGCCEDD